ncbi:MAG: cation diffusion facilitator family transporter [Tannerella sp.]|nr:cation diffusion facilitator family transporter [Tannerella sp.]
MAHPHHEHAGRHEISSLNRAFIIGITLNALFVLFEFIAGFATRSVGLMSDAGHNLSDVVSLILAMLAFRLSEINANSKYTYGYKKSTILISLLNAILLLIAVGVIAAESIGKIISPQPVEGGVIAWVAATGVLINAFTAWLFMKNREKDLNVKGAYLHMAADALVSAGVMVSGIVIAYTGWLIPDPVIGLTVAAVIVHATWQLLRDSVRLSLDGVPAGISIDDIEAAMRAVDGIRDIHHTHIWALSTTETALTAHIVVDDAGRMETVKRSLKLILRKKAITHATLEFETDGAECTDTCNGADRKSGR